jgi:hypothetical protein
VILQAATAPPARYVSSRWFITLMTVGAGPALRCRARSRR